MIVVNTVLVLLPKPLIEHFNAYLEIIISRIHILKRNRSAVLQRKFRHQLQFVASFIEESWDFVQVSSQEFVRGKVRLALMQV